MTAREGQRLGRYTLVRRLGKGGGGEAWEAILHGPRGFTRPVALKFVHDGVAEGPELDNLVQEARIGALLHHPNVVGTYELAEDDGVVFIALELVRGLTVRELSRQAPLSGAVLLDVGIQACAGLAHIHGTRVDGAPLGLVHRDIKPGNLLIDLGGVVKVADFGITRRVGDGAHTSGTPGYAPPEQFQGRVDARSDLFALGATLANLILGEAPFGRARDGNTELITTRLRDPVFLARLDARLTGGARVLARCLQPDPNDRYPSALELQEAFAGLRSLQPPAPSLRELVEANVHTAPIGSPSELTPQLTPVVEVEPTVVLRGNLPAATDAYFGRPELEALRAALAAGHHLITLTGPGGMGKTRLAIEAARQAGRGAWFFDLADATTLDGLLGALAGALAIELGAEGPTDRVGHALRALGRVVVVFDNLEQVLEPARVAIERFLALAPELVALCTSRLPLKLPAEHRVVVGPLPADEAIALFRARSPRVIPDAELPAVRALVERLDGMPLPIELVAARAAQFSTADLSRRLGQHLDAASDGARPSRHRSVDASLTWSWEVLPDWGRAVLAQLSVFDGGFTARGAAAVLDPESTGRRGPLDALALLTDAGLVRYDVESRRFTLLAVVHTFADARLDPSARDRAQARHGRVFATAGERDVLALLRGPQGTARFTRLLAETDNLLAAARRALARSDGPVAVGTLRALTVVLLRRGPLSTLQGLLDAAVTLPGLSPDERDELSLGRVRCLSAIGGATSARPIAEEALRRLRSRPADATRSRLESEALLALAKIYHSLQDNAVAEVSARASLALARDLGDVVLEAEACALIAMALGDAARFEEARDWYTTALQLFQRLGSARDEARVLGDLGRAEHTAGRFAAARATYQHAATLCRDASDRVGELSVLRNLGLLEKDLRRSRDADALYREARRRSIELGDRATEMWLSGALGYLHLEQLDPADARVPLEEAVTIAEELSDPLQSQWEAGLARLHALRGDQEAATRWITAALGHDAVRTSTVRVWVRCALAEVALRAGRRADALAELDGLQKWLTTRNIAPGSRMHQEVERVRVLIGGVRR
jgi:predicted ATPase